MPTKIKGLTGVDKVEAGAVITNPEFSGNATVTGSMTVGGVNVFSGPYRNLIINGDMQIAQRGTSATGLTTGDYRTVDRWYHNINTAGTWSESQSTDVPTGQGFSSSLKVNCTSTASLSTTNQTFLMQIIEAQNLQHLKYGTSNAESLTLSFWVKSNKTGTYVAWFYHPDDARQTNKTYTINTADTWEKKTITISGDTTGVIDNDNGQGLLLRWVLDTGSTFTSGTSPNGTWEAYSDANAYAGHAVTLADSTSNYFNLTGVQLEVGEGASDFEFLPYDVQLSRCKRYYWQLNGIRDLCAAMLASTVSAYGVITYPVEMRTSPSLSVSATTVVRVSWSAGTSVTSGFSVDRNSPTAGLVRLTTSGLTAGQGAWFLVDTGSLKASAEL
jgi:hypothetical protein